MNINHNRFISTVILISMLITILNPIIYTLNPNGYSVNNSNTDENMLDLNLNLYRYTVSIPLIRDTINDISLLRIKTFTAPLGATFSYYLFVSAGDFSSDAGDYNYIIDPAMPETYFYRRYWTASYSIQYRTHCYIFLYNGYYIYKLLLNSMAPIGLQSQVGSIRSRPLKMPNNIYFLSTYSNYILLYKMIPSIDQAYEVSRYTVDDLSSWYSSSWYLLDSYNDSFYGAFAYESSNGKYYIILFRYDGDTWTTNQLGPYDDSTLSTLFLYIGSNRHMDIGYGYIVFWDSYNLVVYNESDNSIYNTTTPGFDSSDYNIKIINYNNTVYAAIFGRDTNLNKYVVRFIDLKTLNTAKTYVFDYTVSRVRMNSLELGNTTLIVIPFENYLILLDMEKGYNIYPGPSGAIEVFAETIGDEVFIFVAYLISGNYETYIDVFTNTRPDYRASNIGNFYNSQFIDIKNAIVGNKSYIILSSQSLGVNIMDLYRGTIQFWTTAGYYPYVSVYDDKVFTISLYTTEYSILDLNDMTWSDWKQLDYYIYSGGYVVYGKAYFVTYSGNNIGFTVVDLATYYSTPYMYNPPPGYELVISRGYVVLIIEKDGYLYSIVPVKDDNGNYYLMRISFSLSSNNIWFDIIYGPDNNIPIAISYSPLQNRHVINDRYFVFPSDGIVVILDIISGNTEKVQVSPLGSSTNYDIEFSWDKGTIYIAYMDENNVPRLALISVNGTLIKEIVLKNVYLNIIGIASIPYTNQVVIGGDYNTMYIVDIENNTIAYGIAYPLYPPVEPVSTDYISVPWILNYTSFYIIGFITVDMASQSYQVIWYTRSRIIPVNIELELPSRTYVYKAFNISLRVDTPIKDTFYYVIEGYHENTWRTLWTGYIVPGETVNHTIALTDIGRYTYRAYIVYGGAKIYSKPVHIDAYEPLSINITHPNKWVPIIPCTIIARAYDNATHTPLRDIRLNLYLLTSDGRIWISSSTTDIYGEALFAIKFYQTDTYRFEVEPDNPHYTIVYGERIFNITVSPTKANISYVYLSPIVKLYVYSPMVVELGEKVNAYIVFIWNGVPTDPDNIEVSLNTTYNMTRISKGVYMITFKPTETGLYVINAEAEYSGMKLYSIGYTMVYNMTSEVNETLSAIVSIMYGVRAKLLGIMDNTAIWVLGNTTITLNQVKEIIRNTSEIIEGNISSMISGVGENITIVINELIRLANETYNVLSMLNETYNLTNIAGRLDAIEDEIAVIRTSIGYVVSNITELNMSILTVRDQLALINSSIGILYTKLDILNASLTGIEGDLAVINTSLGSIEVKLDSINARIGFINDTILAINTSIEDIKVNIKNITDTLPVIINSISSVNGTVSIVVSRISGLENMLNNMSYHIEDIYGELAIIKTDAGYIISNITLLKPVIIGIWNKTAEIQTVLGEINETLEDLLGWAELINESLAVLHTTVGDLIAEINITNEGIHMVYEDIQWIKGIVREIKNNTIAIEALIDNAYRNITLRLGDLNASIVDIDGRLALIESNMGYLISSIDNLSYNITRLSNDILELKTVFGVLEVNISRILSDISYLNETGVWITGVLEGINETGNNVLIAVNTLNGVVSTGISDLNNSIVYLGRDVSVIKTNIGFVLANTSTILDLIRKIKSETDKIDQVIAGLSQVAQNASTALSSTEELNNKIADVEARESIATLTSSAALATSILALAIVFYTFRRK